MLDDDDGYDGYSPTGIELDDDRDSGDTIGDFEYPNGLYTPGGPKLSSSGGGGGKRLVGILPSKLFSGPALRTLAPSFLLTFTLAILFFAFGPIALVGLIFVLPANLYSLNKVLYGDDSKVTPNNEKTREASVESKTQKTKDTVTGPSHAGDKSVQNTNDVVTEPSSPSKPPNQQSAVAKLEQKALERKTNNNPAKGIN